MAQEYPDEQMTGSIYVDSRGVEVVISFSEALETIHGMAARNLPDAHDLIQGGRGMPEMAVWQKEALDSLEDLVVNHHEAIDETFLVPARAEYTDARLLHADLGASPETPSNAIRICLAMAEQVAIDPSKVQGVAEADESDREQVAIDLTQDFLRLHADDLDSKITTVPVPGF